MAKKCVDRYVSLARRHGGALCRIHFGNAEPLLNWPVLDMVLRYCSGITDLAFDFAVNTNLSLMSRDMAKELKAFRVRIATSLDGMPEANDAIRITKGGQGTFSTITDHIDMLSDIGYPLDGFSITVTKTNFDLIGTDIIEWARDRNMTSMAFDYDLVDLVDIPVDERVEKLMRLKKYANKLGMDFFGTWDTAFRNLMDESELADNRAFCAAVGGKSLEFNVDGTVKVCSHLTGRIGHVDQFDQLFANDGALFELVADRFPGTDKRCVGCAIEGLCAGQCHVTREAETRFVKKRHCRLFDDMCGFYRAIDQ